MGGIRQPLCSIPMTDHLDCRLDGLLDLSRRWNRANAGKLSGTRMITINVGSIVPRPSHWSFGVITAVLPDGTYCDVHLPRDSLFTVDVVSHLDRYEPEQRSHQQYEVGIAEEPNPDGQDAPGEPRGERN